jgi:hypothetical protein
MPIDEDCFDWIRRRTLDVGGFLQGEARPHRVVAAGRMQRGGSNLADTAAFNSRLAWSRPR